MSERLSDIVNRLIFALIPLVFVVTQGCNYTMHVSANQHLLRKTSISLKSDHYMANKGELIDNLYKITAQKPNSYFLKIIPVKLSIFNKRYNKVINKPDSSFPKYCERPVIYDSSTMQRSLDNMRSYLFHQGFLNTKVTDTVIYRKKKAFVYYKINAGTNYIINKIHLHCDDTNIARIVEKNLDGTVFKKGKEFAYSLAADESSRITAIIRNNGYYKFTQESVSFKIDTFDKSFFKDIESPFLSAVNYVSASRKSNKKPTLDIDYYVKMEDDPKAYTTYKIGIVEVFPDFNNQNNILRKDTFSKIKIINGVKFKYHDDYVHSHVLYRHIYLSPGDLYSQFNFDHTHAKLNELGIFQYIKLDLKESHKNSDTLNCNIYLTRAKRYDFGANYEVSSGSTYSLGHQLGVNFKEKNFMKGANLLTLGVNGGLEYFYKSGSDFFNNFNILTRYYGVTASLNFPKFLSPVGASLFNNSNLPHTIIGGGGNVIDRVEYFKLVNTSANFTYGWHQNATISWNLSPISINIIRLPFETDSFKRVLQNNDYLKNSYKQNFIEGENLTWIFDDGNVKHGVNYTYIKLGLEEAGGLLGGVNQLGVALNDLYKLQYAQYTKFDFDIRRYTRLQRSTLALRFYGGVGVPYGQSDALPYIKQYFAGGPYGLRGWRIRTLGPGSYFDKSNTNSQIQIDRTGDIKLEMNAEYRFPIAPLFAGAIKMNGVIFGDAGNIWLTKKDANYPGGEFELNTLGQDIAVDGGIGARFDIASFLTLRADMAVPLKKPNIYDRNGWVTQQIDFGNGSWRANNVLFNVSIGYPF